VNGGSAARVKAAGEVRASGARPRRIHTSHVVNDVFMGRCPVARCSSARTHTETHYSH